MCPLPILDLFIAVLYVSIAYPRLVHCCSVMCPLPILDLFTTVLYVSIAHPRLVQYPVHVLDVLDAFSGLVQFVSH